MQGWVWLCTPLIPALRKQDQAIPVNSRLAQPTQQVPDQPRFCSETISSQSIYKFIKLSSHPSIHPSMHPSIHHLSIHPFAYLSSLASFLPTHLPTYLPTNNMQTYLFCSCLIHGIRFSHYDKIKLKDIKGRKILRQVINEL